jgi:hypothetical protein
MPFNFSATNLGHVNGTIVPHSRSLVAIDQRNLNLIVQEGNLIGDQDKLNKLNGHVNSLEIDRNSKPYLLSSAPPLKCQSTINETLEDSHTDTVY